MMIAEHSRTLFHKTRNHGVHSRNESMTPVVRLNCCVRLCDLAKAALQGPEFLLLLAFLRNFFISLQGVKLSLEAKCEVRGDGIAHKAMKISVKTL